MSEAVKVRCPQCKNVLRMPREWLEHSIRCQHCAKSFRAVLKSKVSIPADGVPASAPPPKPADDAVAKAALNNLAPHVDHPSASFTGGPGNVFSEIPISRPLAIQPKPNRALAIVGAVTLLACAAIALGLYQAGWFRGPPTGDSHSAGGPDSGRLEPIAPKVTETPKTDATAAVRRFPRRLLFIGIHQYAYANPVSPTPTALLMTRTVRDFAAAKLRIDKDQVAILSDLADREARPPLKSTIEQTIEQFLTTSRPQDRIILIFVGHAVDLDDQPYLVPIEGELNNKNSLILLSWLYDRLATCPAQQKLLVLDTCRMDSARGFERPGGGPMGAKLDAALANPPPGVQVWSACTANQYSYEFEQASVRNTVVRGGAFLSLLTQAFAQGGQTQKPEDPLPLDFLLKQVNAPVQEIVARREMGATQTPRLAGEAAADGAAYDPSEPMPPPIQLPALPASAPGGFADAREMERLIAEIAVPPLKLPRENLKGQETPDQQAAALAATFPFAALTMKPYAADYENLRQILDKPKEHPLRVAVLRTVESLDRQGRLNRIRVGDKEVSADSLIEKVRNVGADDAVKKSLTRSQQDGPALMLVELQELLELMEKAGRERDREPSKRWQAHFDYVLARLKMRMVYVNEYNVMIAKVKRDELPKLDPKLHNGWRLAAQERITSPKDVKDLASDSRKLLSKLIEDHPGTPWEVLAKRERSTALGLAWQPTNLSNE